MVNVNTTPTHENLAVADKNLMMVDENKDGSAEPAYHSPTQNIEEVTQGMSDGDTVAGHYQSLNITTMDYVNLYSRPVKEREGVVFVNNGFQIVR